MANLAPAVVAEALVEAWSSFLEEVKRAWRSGSSQPPRARPAAKPTRASVVSLGMELGAAVAATRWLLWGTLGRNHQLELHEMVVFLEHARAPDCTMIMKTRPTGFPFDKWLKVQEHVK